MPTDASAPRKTFSYDEASALLPEVRRLTEQAWRTVEELSAAGSDAEGRIHRKLAEWAEAVSALGVEVKGPWLVDFDTGSGYYCWRYPEEGLHYFHSYEDGFRGRLRLQ